MKPKAAIAFALRKLANKFYTPPPQLLELGAPAQRRPRKTKFTEKVKVRRKMARESRRKNRGK